LFDEQVRLQAEEGVDFFICETFHYVEEALLALQAVQAVGLPAMITMAFKETERTRDGHSVEECARRLAGDGADIIGANCARDPAHMLPIVEKMRAAVQCYIAAQPVAYRTTDAIPYFNGLPEFPLELDPLQMTRKEMAAYAIQARDLGVNFIGSCCGTAAHHVRAMAEALGRQPAASDTTPDLAKHPILGTNAPRTW
jgi:betaine-homocysteine S-methyltransferase